MQDALGSDDKWVSAKSPHRAKILSLVPQLRGLFGRLCETFDRNFRFLNTTRLLQTNYRSFALLNNLNEKDRGSLRRTAPDPDLETNSIINKLIAGNDTPFIYEKTGNTFSHFMIDEFQDTSSQQWQNFVPLLENAVAQQDEFPVLLVGDVKTVDLPVAGRRLADSGTESPRSVRADRRADSGHELSQFGNDRRLQQQPDRTVRPVGQRIAEPAARRVRRGGNHIGLPAPRTDRHAGGSLQRPKTKSSTALRRPDTSGSRHTIRRKKKRRERRSSKRSKNCNGAVTRPATSPYWYAPTPRA